MLEKSSEDKAALEAAATALEQKAYKLAEEMYRNTGAQAGGPAGAGAGSAGGSETPKKDGVVDAEFESN